MTIVTVDMTDDTLRYLKKVRACLKEQARYDDCSCDLFTQYRNEGGCKVCPNHWEGHDVGQEDAVMALVKGISEQQWALLE